MSEMEAATGQPAALALLAAMIEAAREDRATDQRRRRPASTQVIGLSPFALLAACGGGGGGGGAPLPPPPPVVTGVADNVTITAGSTAATGNVLANDATTSGTLAVTSVSVVGGATGTLGQPMEGTLGTITIAADGAYSFSVADNAAVRALAAGQTATNSFSYTPSVGSTAGAPQTVTVTVIGVNDAPVAVADVAAITAGSASVTGNVRTNDTDVDAGTTLTVTAVAGGTVGQSVAGQFGAVVINADGSYTYTLDNAAVATRGLAANQTGTDSFTYTISDGSQTSATTLTVTVTGVNDNPVARDDTGFSVVEGASPATVTGNVLTNDSDPDAGTTLQVQLLDGVNLPRRLIGTYGSMDMETDGSFVYTLRNFSPAVQQLAEGERQTDSFTYTVIDGAGGMATATVSITVIGVAAPFGSTGDNFSAMFATAGEGDHAGLGLSLLQQADLSLADVPLI